MNKIGQLWQQIRSARSLRRSAGPLSPAARAAGVALFLVTLLVLLGTAAARTTRIVKAKKTSAVYIVTATAYEAVAGQTDSKPFLTADNSRIPRGYGSHTHWLALSRDLLRPWGGPFDFGDKVRVEGISPALDGVYTVHDTMHPRFRHRLDVLAHPREHLSLSQPDVKLRRVSAVSQTTSRRLHSTNKTRAKVIARHPVKLRQQATNHLVTRTKPAWAARRLNHDKRPASVAHQKPGAAKKQLAAHPKRSKKPVVAHVKRTEPKRTNKLRASRTTRKARHVARLVGTAYRSPAV